MTHPSQPYNTIDAPLAQKIRDLHGRHPKLGHSGLLHLLDQEGIRVDPQELERFMKERGIRAEKARRAPRVRGAPAWLIGAGAASDSEPDGDGGRND